MSYFLFSKEKAPTTILGRIFNICKLGSVGVCLTSATFLYYDEKQKTKKEGNPVPKREKKMKEKDEGKRWRKKMKKKIILNVNYLRKPKNSNSSPIHASMHPTSFLPDPSSVSTTISKQPTYSPTKKKQRSQSISLLFPPGGARAAMFR